MPVLTFGQEPRLLLVEQVAHAPVVEPELLDLPAWVIVDAYLFVLDREREYAEERFKEVIDITGLYFVPLLVSDSRRCFLNFSTKRGETWAKVLPLNHSVIVGRQYSSFFHDLLLSRTHGL